MKNNIIHTFVILAYKESEYLDDCIKSVLNQKYKSDVVIATSTPNNFIKKVAKLYKLKIIVNENHINIGGDFDFAIKCANTKLVTIAHQDDIYDYSYSFEMVEAFKNNNDAIILFPNYYEIKNDSKIYDDKNLKIKRFLLKPLLNYKKNNLVNNKRSALKYGNSICCPSVTFNKEKVIFPVFECDFKCNVDWNAWEKLSKLDGSFIYLNKYLMGHRIHGGSTTTEIIHDNIRTKEDYEIFKRFWPKMIATILTKIYKNSEKNNDIS
jgi:glycosyltransferase involved in cell wall biosynthesis